MGTRLEPRRYDGRRQAWPDDEPSLAEALVYVVGSAAAFLLVLVAVGWLMAAGAGWN